MRNWQAHVTAAALGLVLAAPVAAVTVGDMRALSAVGEPLQLDIGLADAFDVRDGDITVGVASAADHARFGVTRPFDAQQNIRGAMIYLKWLEKQFGPDWVRISAAYNAGEQAVIRHGGVPPYQETQEYVQRVLYYSGQDPTKAIPPLHGALLKNEQDVMLFERLAFMARRNP